MPRVPLFDPHREGVDVLIEQFEQTNGLDDRLILPVHVQCNFIPRKCMGKTKSRLFQLDIGKLLVFQKTQEMLSKSTDQFGNDCGSVGAYLQLLVDRARHLVFTDSELHLGLLLEREVFGEEVDEFLRSLACN
jgi:hypothetical protein